MTEVERESVEAYVKDHIAEWLEASHPSPAERRLDLIERIVRVEEALKNQNILMEKRFEAIDKRFSELREDMNRRFATMQWMMFFGFTLIGLMVTVYRFFGTTG